MLSIIICGIDYRQFIYLRIKTMSSVAEVTMLTKIAWAIAAGICGAAIAAIGWFLNRYASQNDIKHVNVTEEIKSIHKSIELIEKAAIASEKAREVIAKDIEQLKNKITEIEEIGSELQTALKVEAALKKREEMDALKQIMKVAGRTDEKQN